jgi:hypothetical protein
VVAVALYKKKKKDQLIHTSQQHHKTILINIFTIILLQFNSRYYSLSFFQTNKTKQKESQNKDLGKVCVRP